jgi:D-lactate dehydrogenase
VTDLDVGGVAVSTRAIDRFALAHDASHYLLVPLAVAVPRNVDEVAKVFAASRRDGRPMTFRSGGTSLSGQAISDSLMVDTRRHFRRIDLLDDGARVRVQPGATVRQVNARLLRRGRKLGPDPASEIACTIGGVIANNSSGMACGIEQNTYRTLESMVLVLPSGTVLDSSATDVDERLQELEPELSAGLSRIRESILSDAGLVETLHRQYSMKNTMGYGLNSFLDYSRPIDILTHLLIGSEGTLGFVAEATFNTVPSYTEIASGLAIFPDLRTATVSLPALVRAGFATIELMDARSLSVAQQLPDCPPEVAAIGIRSHAAFLVEVQESTTERLAQRIDEITQVVEDLDLEHPLTLSTDPGTRAQLWHMRKGLYPAVAGARPSGTTALLEDIAVPIETLYATCDALTHLFDAHGYEGTVIFGHAKDGNIHFMVNEDFGDPDKLARYRRFTEDMVELVLSQGGTLKAEHGTGRIMAPFVRRQFGDKLYEVMREIKHLCDPDGYLNPGVLLSADRESYLENLKVAPAVEAEVDRCVECGYCEQSCPSKDLTLTPRQRIVVRRERRRAEESGNQALVAELDRDYGYDGVETCAVDGMCATACPVGINTGDLVRRLRLEAKGRVQQNCGRIVAGKWDAVTVAGGIALTAAKMVPPFVVGITRMARSVFGAETVPLYDRRLPSGGSRRRRRRPGGEAEAVYFPACIGTIFGPHRGSVGVRTAFLALCDRAGVMVEVPAGIEGMCCGTPWKSKGYSAGHEHMSANVLSALLEASDNGRLPIVCDAASCTEGLETVQQIAADAGPTYAILRFVDSVEFTVESILPALTVTAPVESVVVHHTCSTTALGANDALTQLARFVSDDVVVPIDSGCCAFAGDRGLLHPEFTASATRLEAAELSQRHFAAAVSANRTCEIGMTRATGQVYRHVLELLEEATLPV